MGVRTDNTHISVQLRLANKTPMDFNMFQGGGWNSYLTLTNSLKRITNKFIDDVYMCTL